ncbi:MAG: flagellar motor switch protein FliN [Rhodospirillaceae bacterium]|jgi:flagellar motor switch protein FliN/FliY|nr:flagellar motor switch protein FliN [Rhodospirillaceae bacterium]MBT7250855.1 flagellar motor switch protein FliN [Rhodospirillaceae bacterium]
MADNDPQTVGDVLGIDEIVTQLDAVLDVEVEITAVLGTSMMPISQILKLGRGAVVELNRGVGEDIDIHANTRLVATGEVIVIEDRLGVNITEIVKCPSSYKLEQSTA